ncbi:chromosome segregation and condensation protein ScpA [Thermaerobacter marianensis DSM 12885]|uniref:Segregation and condensation protein A n=1 Tax=Thermaerobacter marianensis (strain ATCC 700841 / DSM 12885 / JCM 10246 / 7p75a) TaxID=644966 RepID=E6SKN8_THEM7|nr:segregation/condensation protein A [Thermaerobacter marianensis]ADU51246.1 chromosome segregation and condensation protein ScpA [Thermaerobacter marianensis DSM 12885]
MAYTVRLDQFEGPLDLLLQLIEKQEIDIHDIPIARITEQYLEHLEAMRRLDLEVTSEFVVLAAQLIDIKARMLLPPEPREDDATAEEEADPREELVRRLLEYRQYKEAARYLSELAEQYGGRYPRLADAMAPLAGELQGLEGVTLDDLVRAFATVLAAVRETPEVVVEPEAITVAQQMDAILGLLAATRGPVTFRACFSGRATRMEVVVTFLALLELIRQGRVRVRQDRTFGEIVLYPGDGGRAPARSGPENGADPGADREAPPGAERGAGPDDPAAGAAGGTPA